MFRPLKRYQILTDVGIAVVFFLLSLYFSAAGGWSMGYGSPTDQIWPGVIPILVLFSAAQALRRRSPGLALGIAWVGAIVQMAMGFPPLPVNVVVFAVLYTAAAYGTRLVYWLGFASAFVGAIAIVLYLLSPSLLDIERLLTDPAYQRDILGPLVVSAVLSFIAAAFALLLAWTTGALVRVSLRARQTRRDQERAEQQTVAEQERVRIARDMHDVVAHSLAVVIAQADGARYAAAADPDAATRALGTISTTARAALSDVRLLLTQLRHSQAEGPQPTLADLETLYAQVRAAGVALQIDVDPMPMEEPPAAVQLAVYRILQEALTNALRHGGGGPVDVQLSWHADHVALRVGNALKNPGAAPAHGAAASGGHGLIGMRERAQLVGGRLTAGAAEGRFVVSADLPLGSLVEAGR